MINITLNELDDYLENREENFYEEYAEYINKIYE